MTIFQLNIFLLCSISVMAICHRDSGRVSAVIYAFLMITKAIVCHYKLDGYQYFIGAAIFEAACVIILCRISSHGTSRMSDILVGLSAISWLVSGMGVTLWLNKIGLTAYYHACATVYASAVITMLWEDGTHDKGRSFVSRVLRFASYPGMYIRHTVCGKAAQ